MRIIEIAALPNGAHRNQTGKFKVIPDGWALVPDDMEIPATFPFVGVTAEDGIVTSMTEGVVPEEEPVEREPTIHDILNAMLGVTDNEN